MSCCVDILFTVRFRYFTSCCDKILHQKHLKGEAFVLAHWLLLVVGGQLYQQELEVVSHITFTVMKQRLVNVFV